MTTNQPARMFRFEVIAIRLATIVVALMLIAVGVTLLTSPLTVPVTVALWLGAAAVVYAGLAITMSERG